MARALGRALGTGGQVWMNLEAAFQQSELYEPDDARLWLSSPHPLLGDDRPADRIRANQADDVLASIAQLRDGAFV